MKHDSLKLVALYVACIGATGAPSGEIYARMMCGGVTLDLHQRVLIALQDDRACRGEPLIHVKNDFVSLTEKGMKLYADICAALPASFSN